MARRVLITGGAGFIGSHLADDLIGAGYAVRVFDNCSPQVHGAVHGRPSYLCLDVDFVRGDVQDGTALRRALRGIDCVVHLAAMVGVGRSMYEVADYTAVNDDRLIDQGVEYLYFIDEIFLPNRPLLEALVGRDVVFGVQTRIDLWKPEMIELLGRAGCVSIEAGVESLTHEGRDALDRDCRLGTEELTERLILAKRCVPFVQANLIETPADDAAVVQRWRGEMQQVGIWANDPVPLFPYPGSPDYRKLWGPPTIRRGSARTPTIWRSSMTSARSRRTGPCRSPSWKRGQHDART